LIGQLEVMPRERLLLMVDLVRLIEAGGRHEAPFAPKGISVRRPLSRRLGLGVDRAECALLVRRPVRDQPLEHPGHVVRTVTGYHRVHLARAEVKPRL
jgi:hypothetical protein